MGARIQVRDIRLQGFRAITVANAALSLTMVPELGGKICSIRDARTGREWLWTNPSLSYQVLPPGASYVELADTGGWDECFPTVAPCRYPLEPWRGRQVPDHGELWSRAWPVRIVHRPDGGVSLHAAVESAGPLSYRWRRVVTLAADAAVLRFDYRLTNTARTPLAFIWSAHPLFAIEPGMRIQIPAGTRMHTWISLPAEFVASGDHNASHTWPIHGSTAMGDLDLSVVPAPTAGVGVKLWSEQVAEGTMALVARDGSFRFAFDPARVPQVALWLNAGAWSGAGSDPYYNLALEPCIGAQDSLEAAVERQQPYGLLPARGRRDWWIEAHLETRAEG